MVISTSDSSLKKRMNCLYPDVVGFGMKISWGKGI